MLQEIQRRKEEREREQQLLEALIMKRKEYANIVRTKFAPKIDEKKREEVRL